jgi:hypothetical protein
VTTRDPARDRASISSVGLIIVDAGLSAKRPDRFRVYPVRAAGTDHAIRPALKDFALDLAPIICDEAEWRSRIFSAMTICIGVVDERDAIIASDGRLSLKKEGAYAESWPKSIRLNSALAVAFSSRSLASVRSILMALVPDFSWPTDGETLLSAWEKSRRYVTFGYVNAKGRIAKAMVGIKADPDYTHVDAAVSVLLAGRTTRGPRLACWDSEREEDEPTETNRGRKIIGSPPTNREDFERLTGIIDAREMSKGAQKRLVDAISFCGTLEMQDVNGIAFTRRLSDEFQLRDAGGEIVTAPSASPY